MNVALSACGSLWWNRQEGEAPILGHHRGEARRGVRSGRAGCMLVGGSGSGGSTGQDGEGRMRVRRTGEESASSSATCRLAGVGSVVPVWVPVWRRL